jgi:hypothetical protein
MSSDNQSLPRSLAQINTISKTKIAWEEMRGKGLPDTWTNEWMVIVNLFQEGNGHRNDQTELNTFFHGVHANHRTYNALNERLRWELKRRGNGKINDCARINKKPKSMARECAPLTTPAIAAAAEGSPPLPDGASARPRPPPTRRGRLPDDPARRWAGGGAEACGGGAQGPPAPRASAPPAAATPSQIDAAHAALSYSHGCGAPRGHCLPIYPLGTFRAA